MIFVPSLAFSWWQHFKSILISRQSKWGFKLRSGIVMICNPLVLLHWPMIWKNTFRYPYLHLFVFLVFAVYTVRAAQTMNVADLLLYSLVKTGVLMDHKSSAAGLCWRHLCSMCSVVGSSQPHRQVDEGAGFNIQCIELFSLLCLVWSMTRAICCSQGNRW